MQTRPVEADGDGVVADLQDPPELIPEMIAKWEEGYSMVLCVKRTSEENSLMFWTRKKYYAWVQLMSSMKTFETQAIRGTRGNARVR